MGERILLCLEEEKISEESIAAILRKKKATTSVYDLPLFKPLRTETPQNLQAIMKNHPLLQEIRSLDPNRLTPLEALVKITEWKRKLEENENNHLYPDTVRNRGWIQCHSLTNRIKRAYAYFPIVNKKDPVHI